MLPAAVLNHHTGNMHFGCLYQNIATYGKIIWKVQAAMLAIRLAIQHMQLAPYILGSSLLTVLAINKGYLFSDWSCTPIIFDIHPQFPFFLKMDCFQDFKIYVAIF
jgi:hypothetical protein